jgi:prepilin-type N-terminal cleavage/methylation domain-containing protein
MPKYIHYRGFTLIELSIVIVIIGLIVAGVVGGQQLVASAKLRTVMQDVSNYTTANHTFFLKYNEYAGDMLDVSTNAYWGVDNNGGESSYPRGDKKVSARYEGVPAWYHLQLSGILKGNYDGVFTNDEVSGVTMGKSGFSDDSGFSIHTLGTGGNQWGYGSSDIYDLTGPTAFFFGKRSAGSTYLVDAAILTPKEAYNIDLKHDDGLPNRGKILADSGRDVGSNNQCLDYAVYASSYDAGSHDGRAYVLTNTTPKCRMMFIFR